VKKAGQPVPVTVVIAARNEARQIADCIGSVSWADEILVVENDSADDTVRRARDAGATVFSHPFTTIAGQRNAAIARASRDWVLVLDADERASEALGEEVRRRVADAGGPPAYRVPRRNVFLGREIHHGGWSSERDHPVRLFRRELRYDEVPVHEHVITTGTVGTLEAWIRHEPYASLDEYFEKLSRYSRDWARQHHARGRRASTWMVVLKPPARFLSMYVTRGGWRDGPHGVVLASLAAVSVAAKYAHLWNLGRRADAGAASP
jgi:glycosyltransferase involved in cell wall biosynthesis